MFSPRCARRSGFHPASSSRRLENRRRLSSAAASWAWGEPKTRRKPCGGSSVSVTARRFQWRFAAAIFPAIAYWVEGDTLNYITVQGAKNSVSLDLVDRDFSKQINKERKVEFGLPTK